MRALVAGLTIFGAALAAAAAPEQPRAMTAGDLAQICTAADDASKEGCRLYILGVTQGISLGMDIADGKSLGGRPCVPDNISGQALELAVKMKLGQDLMVFPADRDLEAAGIIGSVIVTTFPCKKQRS